MYMHVLASNAVKRAQQKNGTRAPSQADITHMLWGVTSIAGSQGASARENLAIFHELDPRIDRSRNRQAHHVALRNFVASFER